MKKILSIFLFPFLLGLATPLAAAQPIAFPPPGMSMEFTLAPHERQEFTNISFSTVNGTCIINTKDVDGTDIFVEVLRKKGKVNDHPLSQGDTIVIRVHDKETMRISAEAGGKVALTNLGEQSVTAKCSSTV